MTDNGAISAPSANAGKGKSTKSRKPARPKARRPRGFEDKPVDVIATERALVGKACAVYAQFGFLPLETPTLEYADALGKFLPDADRPNEGVFAFQDDGDQWVSMRYDLTAPLARYVAENFDALPKPFRRYQSGPVYRNEKPGPGRYREFIQCDADTVGAGGIAADAEMIALAARVMGAVGLKTGEYVVRYNDRRFLDGLLAMIGVASDAEGAETRLRVLRAIDKLDRLGLEGVEALLGEGRKDESGDYTEGAKLNAKQVGPVLDFVRVADLPAADRMGEMGRLFRDNRAHQDDRLANLTAELETLSLILATLGAADAAVFDPSIVRGLAYYTGPVFEAEVLFDTMNDKGKPVRVGSVGGGGRYDDLVSRFRGQPVPATGFSFGVSRFAAALRMAGRLGAEHAAPLAVVLVMDAADMPDYFQIAEMIRAEANIPAEVFLGGGNMGKQLKYADKRGARFAVIMGEDERQAGQVTVKDLKAGAEKSQTAETRDAWRAAEGVQVTIARSELAGWLSKALKADAG